MSARQSIDTLERRGKRLAAFASMVETYRTPRERKQFIMWLHQQEVLTPMAVELLLEMFGLEAA